MNGLEEKQNISSENIENKNLSNEKRNWIQAFKFLVFSVSAGVIQMVSFF